MRMTVYYSCIIHVSSYYYKELGWSSKIDIFIYYFETLILGIHIYDPLDFTSVYNVIRRRLTLCLVIEFFTLQ